VPNRDHLGVGLVAVPIDHSGAQVARSTQGFLEEALGGSRVTAGGDQKINRSACGIDGAVQANPLALHPNVGLIHSPGAVGGLQFPAPSLVQFGRVAPNPTPDGGVVGGEAPLGEEFLDVAIGKGKSQTSAHRTGNDGRFEVAPLEQRCPGFAHQGMISGPRQPPSSSATLPSLRIITPGMSPKPSARAEAFFLRKHSHPTMDPSYRRGLAPYQSSWAKLAERHDPKNEGPRCRGPAPSSGLDSPYQKISLRLSSIWRLRFTWLNTLPKLASPKVVFGPENTG